MIWNAFEALHNVWPPITNTCIGSPLYYKISARVSYPNFSTTITISSDSSTNIILMYMNSIHQWALPSRFYYRRNRRILNHNFSFEFEKYISCVLGQKEIEIMKLQLLTCGLVFGQKVKPTFSPDQSIKRYTSIRNQYAG